MPDKHGPYPNKTYSESTAIDNTPRPPTPSKLGIITTAARRLTLQHNNAGDLVPGSIYEVNLNSGEIERYICDYAAEQYKPGHADYGVYALIRISYGRIRQAQAQKFLDSKGEGW